MNPIITELHEKLADERAKRKSLEDVLAMEHNERLKVEREAGELEAEVAELKTMLEEHEAEETDNMPKPNWTEGRFDGY